MPMNAYQTQVEERAEHAATLRERHLNPNIPAEVAAIVFDLAYEDGHEYGRSEIEEAYVDLASLTNAAFEAGEQSNQP